VLLHSFTGSYKSILSDSLSLSLSLVTLVFRLLLPGSEHCWLFGDACLFLSSFAPRDDGPLKFCPCFKNCSVLYFLLFGFIIHIFSAAATAHNSISSVVTHSQFLENFRVLLATFIHPSDRF